MNDDIPFLVFVFVLIFGSILGLVYMDTEKDKLMIERGYIWQPAQWIKAEEVKE